MNNSNLLKRQIIENLLNESRLIVKNANHIIKTIVITEEDKRVFNELAVMLCASISTFDNSISLSKFFRDYISLPYSSAQRIFLKKGDISLKGKTITRTLDEFEEIANRELGTLEELKEANDGKGALVV